MLQLKVELEFEGGGDQERKTREVMIAASSSAGHERASNECRYKSASEKIPSPLVSRMLANGLFGGMQRFFDDGHTVPMEVRIDTSRATREGVSSKRRRDACFLFG